MTFADYGHRQISTLSTERRGVWSHIIFYYAAYGSVDSIDWCTA